jgi:hypothetical protein
VPDGKTNANDGVDAAANVAAGSSVTNATVLKLPPMLDRPRRCDATTAAPAGRFVPNVALTGTLGVPAGSVTELLKTPLIVGNVIAVAAEPVVALTLLDV